MSAEIEPKREPWLVYPAIAAIFTLLYAASWGPLGSLAINSTNMRGVAEAAYAPIGWLYWQTPLSAPLDWYWNLFSSLRPRELRNIPEIWERTWIKSQPGEEFPWRTHGGVI